MAEASGFFRTLGRGAVKTARGLASVGRTGIQTVNRLREHGTRKAGHPPIGMNGFVGTQGMKGMTACEQRCHDMDMKIREIQLRESLQDHKDMTKNIAREKRRRNGEKMMRILGMNTLTLAGSTGSSPSPRSSSSPDLSWIMGRKNGKKTDLSWMMGTKKKKNSRSCLQKIIRGK